MQVSKHIPSQIFIALSLMFALSGCALTDLVKGEPEEIKLEANEEAEATAEPGLTPKQRFTNALSYLEFGNTAKALAELKAYDAVVPRNKTVKKLIRQITIPSSDYFPSDYYTLELKSGESLSTLSKKYLGSALDFFALAKYNNVKSARRVLIGQKIKIPQTQLAKSVWQKDQLAMSNNADEISDSMEVDSALQIDDEFEHASKSLEDNADIVSNEGDLDSIDENDMDTAAFEDQLLATQQAIEVTPEQLALEIEQLNMSGEHEEAMTKYEELVSLDESNQSLEPLLMQTLQGRAGQLTVTDPSLAAEYYQRVADMYLDNGDDVGHYVNLAMASKADTSNTQLAVETAKLKKELVDKYHRQASSEFRRQDLEPAIANWDKVLRIDPDHNNAKVFRARAIDLKERLSKIKD